MLAPSLFFSENIITFCMGVSHWFVVHINLLLNCRPYMPPLRTIRDTAIDV